MRIGNRGLGTGAIIGIALVSLMLLAMPSVVGAVGEQRVEETDPSFVWTEIASDNWASMTNDLYEELTGTPGNISGGTMKMATVGTGPGTKVDITFTGMGVALIYTTTDHGGIATVEIDNVSYDNIDFYSSDVTFQVKEVIATDLDNTQHVLTITRSGTKNPASGHYHLLVDAVDVYTQPPATFSNFVISPATVELGQPVTITADVTNTSGLEGTYTVTLKIDGAAVENKDVTVAGGATESVSFTVSKNTTGTYQVAVDSQTGSFTVSEAAAEPTGVSEPPILWVAVVVVVAAIGALLFVKKRK